MDILRNYQTEIRVRYQEADGQGRLHHANYVNYFEVARVEMLRASGVSYRDLEVQGTHLVVVELNCQYFQGASFDDVLTINVALEWAKGVRIKHKYRVFREQQLLAEGTTVVAAIDAQGKVQRLPTWLRAEPLSP